MVKKLKLKKLYKSSQKKINVKKIQFRKEKDESLHYKINPFTYRVKQGIFVKLNKEISLDKGIDEMIKYYIRKKLQ